MLLTIVLPIKEFNELSGRALSSIRYARKSVDDLIEVIVITPKKNISLFENNNLDFDKIVADEGNGIYNAMNLGIEHAAHKYIYFLGVDDILLIDLIQIISDLKTNKSLYLYNVFWGHNRIYYNRVNKFLLSIRNWCHQGVIYKTELLKSIGGYNSRYKVQADHYSNIALLSRVPYDDILKSNKIISWYSADGYSSRNTDEKFYKDYPSILKEHFGYIFYLLIVIKRKLNGIL